MTFSGLIEFILYKSINKANSMPTLKPSKLFILWTLRVFILSVTGVVFPNKEVFA